MHMFLHDVVPYMLQAAAVMIVTYFLTSFISNIYILLVVKIAVATLLYLTISCILRSEELSEIIVFLFIFCILLTKKV